MRIWRRVLGQENLVFTANLSACGLCGLAIFAVCIALLDAAALGDLLADQRMTVLVVAFRTRGAAVPTPASRAHSAASLQLC